MKKPKAEPVHLCSNCARHPQEEETLCFVCVRPYRLGQRAERRRVRQGRKGRRS